MWPKRMTGAINYQMPDPSARIRAAANIRAAGTSAVNASLNIASLTDNGAGDFSLTFVLPFLSASDYVILVAGNSPDVSQGWTGTTDPTASSIRILTKNSAGTNVDEDQTFVTCIGRV